MSSNLPVLLGRLDVKSSVPPLKLDALVKAIKLKKTSSDPLQAAWSRACELCEELQTIESDRKVASEALRIKNQGGDKTWFQALSSKLKTREETLREVFYLPGPEKKWAEFTAVKREAIKKLYLRLLAAEKPVAAKSELDQLICPLCKSEGRIMVRRTIGGTITDISSVCPLCIGSGKKILKLPVGAKLCPDCLGFGRRILQTVRANQKTENDKNNQKTENANISTLGGNVSEDGVFGEPPKITSCSRCLSRGYILQPGLR